MYAEERRSGRDHIWAAAIFISVTPHDLRSSACIRGNNFFCVCMIGCVPRCTNQADFVVGDYPDRNALQQRLHSAFGDESLRELRPLESGQNFCRNPSTEKDASGGHELERQIAGFRTVHADKDSECVFTNRGFGFQSTVRDHRRWRLGMGQLVPQPLWFALRAGIAQILVNVQQSRTRENALPAHAPKFLQQITMESDFRFIAWGKIAVSALTGKGVTPLSVLKKPGLAQAGAGGDQGAVSGYFRAGLNRDEVGERQIVDARGMSLKIVDHPQ